MNVREVTLQRLDDWLRLFEFAERGNMNEYSFPRWINSRVVCSDLSDQSRTAIDPACKLRAGKRCDLRCNPCYRQYKAVVAFELQHWSCSGSCRFRRASLRDTNFARADPTPRYGNPYPSLFPQALRTRQDARSDLPEDDSVLAGDIAQASEYRL